MSNGQEYMKELADNLWLYFEPQIKSMNRDSVRFFRAEVTAAASGGKMTIKKPFDNTSIALPYVTSIAGATVGSQVTVMLFGSLSNGIIIGDGTLSNL